MCELVTLPNIGEKLLKQAYEVGIKIHLYKAVFSMIHIWNGVV